MQMIDDWIDQDEDRAVRSTAVVEGGWTRRDIQYVYQQTREDLTALLEESGIRNKVFKDLLSDLYTDFIYAGLDMMKSGHAA